MPWNTCYSYLWEIKQYGISPGHEEGIFGQFPDVEWEKDLDYVMEQIWAGVLRFVSHPTPRFREKVLIKRI